MSLSSFPCRAAGALLAAFVLLLAAWAQVASAVTVRVDNDRAQCPGAAFRSISAALQFVGPGSTVVVCPGAYFGPLRMAKSGVRVTGLTGDPAEVTVRADPRVPRSVPVVEMSAPATTLAAVTIRENSGQPPTCGTAQFKVVVDNGVGPFARASVVDNVMVHQGFTNRVSPCLQDTVGVSVGGAAPATPAGRAIVRKSRFAGGKSSVVVGAGSAASIHDNVVSSPPSFNEFGVGIVVAGNARIEHNNVSGQGDGVRVDGGHATIGGPGRGNGLHQNKGTGLALEGDADAIVADNAIAGNGNDGVEMSTRGAVVVVGNTIRLNGFGLGGGAGIRVRTTGAVVASNDIRANHEGIVVDTDGSQNRILANVAIDNAHNAPGTGPNDCFDATTGTGTAATANTWIDNIGLSSSPPEICSPPSP
jgi:Periplasmic copper-binding protein (NosD)